MKMKTYHAPNSGIAAYAEGKDYIVIQFKTGERYRYDAKKPGRKHIEEMKSRAHRTSGLTTYINQHVRENYAAKLGGSELPRKEKRRIRQRPPSGLREKKQTRTTRRSNRGGTTRRPRRTK